MTNCRYLNLLKKVMPCELLQMINLYYIEGGDVINLLSSNRFCSDHDLSNAVEASL